VSSDNPPRSFRLQRDVDVTGASGTGHVADGTVWADGTVSIRWYGADPSFINRDDFASVQRIHSHNGATRIIWYDEEPGRG
jgi:hypothetical protein